MTIPALLFALILALLLGALYHFIRDGGLWHLIVYLVASVLGFVIGHLIGLWRDWVFFEFGAFNLGMEVLGGLVCLVLADWLLHLPPRSANGDNAV